MLLWIAGGLVLLYGIASASRSRKQRLVERVWRAALPEELVRFFGYRNQPIDAATAAAVSDAFFDALYRGFGAHDFGHLMRRIIETGRQGTAEAISDAAAREAAAMLPEALRQSGSWTITNAATAAGTRAQNAGDASGEV